MFLSLRWQKDIHPSDELNTAKILVFPNYTKSFLEKELIENNKINNVMLKSAYEHFDDNVFILHNELINGLSMDIYLERYNELVENRDEDIKRYT